MMHKNLQWADGPHTPIRLPEKQENKELIEGTDGVSTKKSSKVN